MTLRQIIQQVRRLAGDGPPPGKTLFYKKTGISDYQYEKFGLTWSEVLAKAGFKPNQFAEQLWTVEQLILFFIETARELGHLPVTREVVRKRLRSRTRFPGWQSFLRIGRSNQQRHAVILDYCDQHSGYEDVAQMCRLALAPQAPRCRDQAICGCVYLFAVGRFYKIGMSESVNQRLEQIRSLLPQKSRLIHLIYTDDPRGVERYWHQRFKQKRLRNEWFKLNPDEVAAFKRWRFWR